MEERGEGGGEEGGRAGEEMKREERGGGRGGRGGNGVRSSLMQVDVGAVCLGEATVRRQVGGCVLGRRVTGVESCCIVA